MHLKKIISEGRKPNKIWVDQAREFYNNAFKDFLKINIIEIYSTYNEGKSVVAEKFIRTLKNKIFKHMIAFSKNIYFDTLDDIVNKCNNTVHKTIKMKPIDNAGDYYIKSNGTIFNETAFNKDSMKLHSNKKILDLKLVIMSEFPNIKTFLLKHILQIGQKKFFFINKIKNTVPWSYVINDLNGEEINASFYEK